MSVAPNHLPEVLSLVEKENALLDCLNYPPLSQIGNTPLIPLRRISKHLPKTVKLYAKAEYLNPGGSVKDRTALQIVVDAIRKGRLNREKTLIDSTSGNTGISYAMICALMGIPVEIVMPASASQERKRILRSYGAKLVLTDPSQGSDGAQRHVREKVKNAGDKYFYADQYNNDANWKAHFEHTAPEIIEQTDGEVTHFVAGLGTTGTFVGVSRRLKAFNSSIQCLPVQPNQAKHGMKGLRHMATALVPGIYDDTFCDADQFCNDADAFGMTRRLAREEGLLVGISAGANVASALKVAEQLDEGCVVTILCDKGNRYLSQPFWA